MSTYLFETFHNAFIHRNIQSNHISSNFKETASQNNQDIQGFHLKRFNCITETSNALQNDYSVPHINVLDKQLVQLMYLIQCAFIPISNMHTG